MGGSCWGWGLATLHKSSPNWGWHARPCRSVKLPWVRPCKPYLGCSAARRCRCPVPTSRSPAQVIRPGPSQAPRVPILVAGGGEKVTLRQVAQYADASNFGAGNTIGSAWTLDDVRRKYVALRGHCEAVGRPYDSVLRTYFGGVLEFGEGVQTREEHFRTAFGQYLVLHGDPKGAVAHYRALVDAGA
jgi:alkanesulfonate monooxygenase SsuD/methylene tetrahydromethanopterin reductase-like flavin-dependent oxidoreductase (luciferase family)